MIKSGDQVVCINSKNVKLVKEGEIYKVKSATTYAVEVYYDEQHTHWYSNELFKKVEE